MAQKKKTTKKLAAKKKAAAKKTTQKTAAKKTPAADPGRVARILDLLERSYPEPTTALDWKTPLQLLVATILSAQCTDERVNKVTPALFRRYPDAASLAAAEIGELEQLIHSTGFFRNKAKAIKGAAAAIAEQHGGKVPRSMEQMVELPGVARKTANVVLGTAYGLATGVVVDTHVKRVSGRLGLTGHTDPNKIERDLMAAVPEERWIALGHQLILHGRALCQARKPSCGECPLAPHCPSAETPA
jgi:endonuclease-3